MSYETKPWKLMDDRAVTQDDRKKLCAFIMSNEKLSYGDKCKELERVWSEWLGVKYSVFVNSGSSANLILVQAMHDLYGAYGRCDWIAQSCTWATNIAPILQLKNSSQGIYMTDVDMKTLGPDLDNVEHYIKKQNVRYLFLTHVLGIPSISQRLLDLCEKHDIILLEDCCESHGSTWNGKKVGTFGKASTFSFFYGHHITSIEGGMVCTDDEDLYHHLLLLRSHGMLRELPDQERSKRKVHGVDERFTFLCSGYNVRNTDVNAVLGISQMNRLDKSVTVRQRNFKAYIHGLDSSKYHTDMISDGTSLFAFPVIRLDGNIHKVSQALKENGIDNRPLIAGNLFRHPMMNSVNTYVVEGKADFIHDNSLYVGNNEFVEIDDVQRLVGILNAL
jgi:CDP-6-deoxy-D-xylo-4-hexulose-3-dehydrase